MYDRSGLENSLTAGIIAFILSRYEIGVEVLPLVHRSKAELFQAAVVFSELRSFIRCVVAAGILC